MERKHGRKIAITTCLATCLATLAAIVWIAWRNEAPDASAPKPATGTKPYPVTAVAGHIHAVAVDPTDPKRVYVGTHEGLYVLLNDTDMFRIGKSRDDYMGFTPHPWQAETLFSSGHPASGGNLGFQISEDAGGTWRKVSDVIPGEPADFHAVTISPANPKIVYGKYGSEIFRSLDAGSAWTRLEQDLAGPMTLAAHPTDERTVYATTIRGIYRSEDLGETWTILAPASADAVAYELKIGLADPEKMYALREDGVAVSNDGGVTWRRTGEGPDEPMHHLSIDSENPAVLYGASEERVYKSEDGGVTWKRVFGD